MSNSGFVKKKLSGEIVLKNHYLEKLVSDDSSVVDVSNSVTPGYLKHIPSYTIFVDGDELGLRKFYFDNNVGSGQMVYSMKLDLPDVSDLTICGAEDVFSPSHNLEVFSQKNGLKLVELNSYGLFTGNLFELHQSNLVHCMNSDTYSLS